MGVVCGVLQGLDNATAQILGQSGSHPLTAMTHTHAAWTQIWPCFRVAFTNFTLATEHNAPDNIYINFFVRKSALRIFLGFFF